MYRERASVVPGAIVWTARPDGPTRVLPDGATDLIWLGDRLIVAGPDTVAHVSDDGRGREITGLRFAPGTGPSVFGVPATELRDRQVDPEDLWPGARLGERLAEAPDVAGVLEEFAAGRLRDAPPPDRWLAPVVAGLRAGRPVAALADDVGLSERQVHRRSLDAFGYGPKTLARILRSVRALALARAGTPLADVAARCGYADQAHLSREIRALTGTTTRTLLHG